MSFLHQINLCSLVASVKMLLSSDKRFVTQFPENAPDHVIRDTHEVLSMLPQ